MATSQELVSHIMRLGIVVRSAHLKRVLTAIEPQPSLNFWCLIYGNLLDVAVLEWCKVFGSDAEPTHWKRVVSDHVAFRRDLLTELAMDEQAWEEYWQEMKTYRDSLVAHHVDPNSLTRWPHLDAALRSCYFYYSYLIRELRNLGDNQYPDNLEEYCERFAAQAKEIAQAALASTARFKERVF